MKILEGSHAIAEAVKQCKPKVISAYPITPQTHIVEKLADMVANAELNAEYINVESEHSALATCIGAQATGVRTFTATCSQGLALMWELLYIASGMRLPIVMAVTNRALSAPLNIWNDWSDSFGARDSGWIQLYCESVQEAFDTILQAYRIAEEKNIQLPVMVCVDGFYLSHIYEPVDITDKKFVKEYKPRIKLDTEHPVTLGEFATPDYYQEFREELQMTMMKAKNVIKNVNDEFSKKYKRKYGNGLIEVTNPGAKHAIVTLGSLAGTIKHVMENDKIKDISLVRIKSLRPFPEEELKKALSDARSIGIIEKDVSPGLGGVLWSELRFLEEPVSSFIGGLGGRDITANDLRSVISLVRKKDRGVHWVGSKL
ncbi:MAG: pyruvate ferredoxin oxidoreductase [Candidatus Aenigmatarchaeota archaeon]